MSYVNNKRRVKRNTSQQENPGRPSILQETITEF